MVKKSSLVLAAMLVLFLGPGLSTASARHRFPGPAFHRSNVGAFRPHFVHHPRFFHPRFFHQHRFVRVFVRYPYPHYIVRRAYFSPSVVGPYCRPY